MINLRIGLFAHVFCLVFASSKAQERRCAIEKDLLPTSQAITDEVALPRSVVTIPVVIHVVYGTSIDSVGMAQILSQLEVLNNDFRRLNSDTTLTPMLFKTVAADVGIEFCLAKRTPTGESTTGVTYTATNFTNIGQLIAPSGLPRLFYTSEGGKDAWDTEHYLNIWVARLGGGILGRGTYPGSVPTTEDGVAIDPRYFGTVGLGGLFPPHHKGRTATHEIGHYFNLQHIWGGNDFTCTDDDMVDDTPIQREPYTGCPTHPQLSCGNEAMFMNFMDYTDDACMNMFTLGQKMRIHAALQQYRPGLMASQGCETVSTIQPDWAVLKLYPNPASERLYIAFGEENTESVQVSIADYKGQVVVHEQLTPADGEVVVAVEALPAGFYVVSVVGGGKRYLAKFLKEISK